MDVASRELCEELYKLTEWGDTSFYWRCDFSVYRSQEWKNTIIYAVHKNWELGGSFIPGTEEARLYYPAYDLSFLLRKLPKQIKFVGGSPAAVWWNQKLGKWQTGYTRHIQGSDNQKSHYFEAETPEDAVAKLAISLIKAKVLS